MKIYFAGSIRAGREDVNIYSEIISDLRKYGEVLTEHVADTGLADKGEQNLSDKFIHDRDMDWLNQSDVLVAETTVPSLGVGYEIRYAVEKKKWVLCLYRPQKERSLSAMISGCSEITIGKYNRMEEVFEIINDFFREYQLSTR